MDGYSQRFAVKTTPELVFAAVAHADGVRGWWSEDCDGDGEAFTVRFGGTRKRMTIVRRDPAGEVRWRCVEAHIAVSGLEDPAEWVGTEIVFRWAPDAEGRVQLVFVHEGLAPGLECFEMCSEGWAYYLGSLVASLETGRGTPHARSAA